MFRSITKWGLLGALLLNTGLTGCFSVEVPPLEPPSGLEKLVAVSDSTIPVRIDTTHLHERSLGHQYLFFALPLTRLYSPTLESDLAMELSVACGMRGYKCVNQEEASAKRAITITVNDANINGYDLLVVRKPAASATLTGRLFESGQVVRECQAEASAINTSHYAFSAELQQALSEALLQGSYKLLDCLGLTDASQ